MPWSLAPTSASALASSISLVDALDPLLALAAGDEIAQPADDLAGAQRLLGGLVERVAHESQIARPDCLRSSRREPFR